MLSFTTVSTVPPLSTCWTHLLVQVPRVLCVVRGVCDFDIVGSVDEDLKVRPQAARVTIEATAEANLTSQQPLEGFDKFVRVFSFGPDASSRAQEKLGESGGVKRVPARAHWSTAL